MAALIEGTLVAHPDWGIALAPTAGGNENGATQEVIWPTGYSGRVDGDRIALVDGNGNTVAHTGDQVSIGGGLVDGSWWACGDINLSPRQSPAPTALPGGVLTVYSAQELADKIGDPNWVGKTVLARAQISRIDMYGQCPSADDPCVRGALDGVSGRLGLLFGWRDAEPGNGVQFDDGNGYRWIKQLDVPTVPGVFAFVLRQDQAEYLGPVILGPEDGPDQVTSLLGNPSDPSDTVFVVSGWLTHTPEAPCPMPDNVLKSPMPDMGSYYCDGSWLTEEPLSSPQNGLAIDGGLHVQGDAYDTFAPDPQPTDGGGYLSRQGIYLIRNAGCPEVVTGDCPVWRMIGRLDGQLVEGSPVPTTPSSAPLVHVSNDTTLRLDVLINGEQAATAEPMSESDVDPSTFPEPWKVTLTTQSGRQLIDFTYGASDVWSTGNSAHGVAQRVDLSCGRLDVYAGPPLGGPPPPESFPSGDCDP